ncbi:MAG: site-2 protease family protein [Anaerolineae bacterium]|nr:site-2 protease family protein [Anaerolineae bacterium]
MQARQGFRIGRVFGIDIRIDWTWLIIFALVTYSLGNTFGQVHSEWSQSLRWGLAVIAALLFFGSVLAHELAHSLVSEARGNPVNSITLFLFGGVSNIKEEPDSPQGEFWMAILGPVTSLVIGVVLLFLAGTVGQPLAMLGEPSEIISELGPVRMILFWLGSVNLVLGIFNLIPGFPLDGGRVLRSILWGATDDLRKATRWASWVGQGFGWLLTMAGIAMVFGASIPFFGSGLFNGLWLAFIGWYLNNASSQSYQKVVVQDILEGVPVKRMMRTDPPTVSPSTSVEGLVHEHILGSDEHAFPVLDDGKLMGIVTLEDVRSISQNAWRETTVREIMTPHDECTVLDLEEDASHAITKLASCDVRQLPVLDGERLSGVLRRQDLIRWMRLHAEAGGWRPRSGIGLGLGEGPEGPAGA